MNLKEQRQCIYSGTRWRNENNACWRLKISKRKILRHGTTWHNIQMLGNRKTICWEGQGWGMGFDV